MGIVSDAGEVKISDELKDLVVLYAEMIKTLRKMNELMAAKQPWKNEEYRFHKIEVKVQLAFDKLTNEEQWLVVDQLIVKKLMPEEVGRALEVFKGRLVKC